ncbi:MAG: HEWD family protein [Halosimplex sp.]
MTTIVPPDERECERCGRADVWSDESGTWTVATDENGDRLAGDPFCLHEWDINGTYNPLGESV